MISRLLLIFRTPAYRVLAATFFTSSFLFGNWVARLPEVKAQLDLSEGELGLVLLSIPLGALLMNPFCGWIIQEGGAGRVTFWSTLWFCLSMILPGLAQDPTSLAAAFFCIGLSISLMNVSMNTATSNIELQDGVLIMAACHGFYSLGGMSGGLMGSLFAGMEWPVSLHLGLACLLMLVMLLLGAREILALPNGLTKGAAFAIPNKAILGLALIAFCQYIAEGSVADWSAIYLHDYLNSDVSLAGLGFAGFSLTMAFGRFNGDWLIPQIGSKRILQGGSFLAGMGFLIAIFTSQPVIAIGGFSLIGLGFSCISPIVFSAATRTPGMSPGAGLAAVSSVGVIGFMMAPPAIGAIAEAWGLGYGLALLAFLSFAIIGLGASYR